MLLYDFVQGTNNTKIVSYFQISSAISRNLWSCIHKKTTTNTINILVTTPFYRLQSSIGLESSVHVCVLVVDGVFVGVWSVVAERILPILNMAQHIVQLPASAT